MPRSKPKPEEQVKGTWAEHYRVEDYPDDTMNSLEGFYEMNPDKFSVKKIMDIDGKVHNLTDKQKQHVIQHMNNLFTRKIMQERDEFRKIENKELVARLLPPPRAARVILTRRGKRFLQFRDLSSGKFVKGIPSQDKTQQKDLGQKSVEQSARDGKDVGKPGPE